MSILDKINKIQEIKSEVIKEMNDFVSDKTKSIDERWDFFITNGEKVLEPDSAIWDFKCFEKFNLNRNPVIDTIHSYYNRHQIISTKSIADSIQKMVGRRFTDRYDRNKEAVEMTQEDVNSFKEECMSEMLIGYEFDW